MQRININKTKNPVLKKYYRAGVEEGIDKHTRFFLDKIEKFSEMDGIGEVTLDKLKQAIGSQYFKK